MVKFFQHCGVLLTVFICSVLSGTPPVVKVREGILQGFVQVSQDGDEFLSFLGIPYAKPPVGKLRFQPPESSAPWKGVRNATVPGADCMQFDSFFQSADNPVTGEEDCLFLNVYTRKLPGSSSNQKRPVFVFIHGGAFMTGTGSPKFYGPTILMNRNIVLVTINYRLGILGFLSSGNKHLPGNYGLKDQVMALKWIQKNIASFGGDPEKVTIFGESAGGASVHYLMLSPLSEGLYQRAISMSGTALCSWAYLNTDVVQMRAKKLSSLFECPDTLGSDMAECLRSKDARDMVKKVEDFMGFGMFPITTFGPTVELEGVSERFLTETPFDLVRKGKVHNVPWVTGVTSNEGLLFTLITTAKPAIMRELKNYRTGFPILMDYEYTTENPEELSEIVKQYYYQDHEVNRDNVKEMSEMLTDRHFLHGIYETVRLQMISTTSPIYFYQLSLAVGDNLVALFGGNLNLKDMGVGHGADLSFIFKFYIFSSNFTEEEKTVSNYYLDFLKSFGETGNPNVAGSSFKWKQMTNKYEYLDINVKPSMRSNLPIPRMDFWSSLPMTDSGRTLTQQQKVEL